MFLVGDVVEIRDEQFEFWFQNEPSGHYAMGEIVEKTDNKTYRVKLFCNGKIYIVHYDFLIKTY